MESMDLDSKYEPVPNPATSITQKVLSVVSLILLFVWTFQHLGGLAWSGSTFFNNHPFFMTMGVAFFLTQGVLSWRDLPLSHGATKLVHVIFNVLALVCLAIGLYVTIDAHTKPHIVTLHSWVALSSLLLLVIQAGGGLFFFSAPIFPFSVRARIMPLHAWLGVVAWSGLMFTLVIGITEWMAFKNAAAGRSAYTGLAGRLPTVLGLCLFAMWLGGVWSMMPRRNVAIDVEERDGAPIDDPSRSRLKGERVGAYGTPTSRPAYSATGGGNPFGTEAVPPRRHPGTIERETTF